MKRILSLLLLVIAVCGYSVAQIVTTSPAIIQDASENVVLTYHAASPLGNNGLAGLTASDPVYAHIGVITNKSKNTSDWKYAPTTWGENLEKYKLTYTGPNTWTLNIGNMRQYFGITDQTEVIEKLAMVFRNSTSTKEGKTKSGGDIFVDVYEPGFQLLLSTDAPGTVVASATTINLTAYTTSAANISITVNGQPLKSIDSATELKTSYNIASTGNYVFEATASDGTTTRTSRTSIAYPGKSTPGTYPGGVPKMGTVKNSDGTVTFCLAAPGKNSVVIVPSWDDYQVLDKNIMQYQDYNGQRYFFTTVSGLKDDVWYPYYYIVDATVKCADPYANLVLDCYSDKWLDKSIWPDMPQYPYDKFDDTMLAVYRGDLNGSYKFTDFTIPNHRNLIIYEMLFRDFTGTDGKADANGTYRKAIAKIPYLKELGVNAVELLPIMEFNGNNSWGYNTNFYMAPDKAYGSPKDLKDFIETCHLNGIAVILDITLNHSDGLHPWYQMYNSSSNPFYNSTAPHDYSVLNDWRQENPLVQQQWKDAITYWMKEYNVDGYRFDLVKGLGTSYPSGTEAYNATRVAVMKNLHAAITSVKPNGIHINENLAGVQEENEMAADGELNWANINHNSCQYAMGYASDSNLARFDATKDGNRTAYSTVSYAQSHDEERLAYKQIAYGASQVKTDAKVRTARLAQVAVQMLLTPGPKMIWQFEELADAQTTKKSDGSNNTDPKIVPWNTISDTNVADILDTYKQLCNFRTLNPELFINGTLTQTGFANNFTSNRIIRVTNGEQEVMAFINPSLSGAVKNIGAASTKLKASNAILIAATPGFTPTLKSSLTSASVQVPANSFAVFATNNCAGVDDIVMDNDSSVKVYVDGGVIHIDGEYNDAHVYTLTGVATGFDVTPGIYLVVVDGTTHKVLVK